MSDAAETAKPSFTPGPWRFIDATKEASMQFRPLHVIQAGKREVASFSWHENSPFFPTKAQSEANARLIAAAPEMRAELRDAREALDAYSDVIDGADGRPAPNKAMLAMQSIDALLARLPA